ncbi:hypothetical protein ACOSQ3_024839 [Xanthoceras sorbifolium]
MRATTSNRVVCGPLLCDGIHGLLLQLRQLFSLQKCKHPTVFQGLCKELLGQKKLQLVLDLDHTLLHTRAFEKLTSEELHLKKPTDENVSNGSLYTDYAEEVAKFLDPEGKYFTFGQEHKKSLDLVLGDKCGIVIFYDTKTAWNIKNRENLIVIGRYKYFRENESHSEIITKKTNDESETDEHGEFVKNLKVLMRIHGLFFESRIKIGGGRDDRRLLDVICGEVLGPHNSTNSSFLEPFFFSTKLCHCLPVRLATFQLTTFTFVGCR